MEKEIQTLQEEMKSKAKKWGWKLCLFKPAEDDNILVIFEIKPGEFQCQRHFPIGNQWHISIDLSKGDFYAVLKWIENKKTDTLK